MFTIKTRKSRDTHIRNPYKCSTFTFGVSLPLKLLTKNNSLWTYINFLGKPIQTLKYEVFSYSFGYRPVNHYKEAIWQVLWKSVNDDEQSLLITASMNKYTFNTKSHTYMNDVFHDPSKRVPGIRITGSMWHNG